MRKAIFHLKNLFIKKLTIRQQYLFFMSLFAVIPFILSLSMSIYNINHDVKNSLIYYSRLQFQNVYNSINNEAEKIVGNAFTIEQNGILQSTISGLNTSCDTNQKVSYYNFMNMLDNQYSDYKIQIFTNDLVVSSHSYNTDSTLINIDSLKSKKVYLDLVNSNNKYIFFINSIDNKQYLSALYKITDLNDYSTASALMMITLTSTDLSIYFDKSAGADESIGAVTMIVDGGGDVVYPSGNLADAVTLNEIKTLTYRKADDYMKGIQLKSNYAFCSKITANDWKIVQLLPNRILYNKLTKLIIIWFTVICLLMIVLAYAVYRVSVFISRPLEKMSYEMSEKCMQEIQSDDYAPDLRVIADAYNVSLERIKQLIKRNEDITKLKSDLELKLLNTQIHPHFLYNALNSLRWEAEKNSCDQVVKSIEALSSYLRLTIEPTENFTELSNEIKHIDDYLKILNLRYNNFVKLHVDVPENCLNIKVTRLCLQPLVENAINHGILMTECEKGTICIHAQKCSGCIKIFVTDDGVGMSKELQNNINRELSEGIRKKYCGVGLYCVNSKIRLFCGDNYGVFIKSELGKGTTAILIIPLI